MSSSTSNNVFSNGILDDNKKILRFPSSNPTFGVSNTSDTYILSNKNTGLEWINIPDVNFMNDKININTSDIANIKGMGETVVTVDKGGMGEYTTIKAAVNYANSLAAIGKRICVSVAPGVYAQELNPITLSANVSLKSQGTPNITIIMPSDVNTHIVEIVENSNIDGFYLMGATGQNGRAIYFNGSGVFGRAMVNMCGVINCTTGVYAENGDSLLLMREMLFTTNDLANYSIGTAIHADKGCNVRVTDVGIYGTNQTPINMGVRVTGSDTQLMLGTCFVEHCNTGVYVQDGGTFLGKASIVDSCGSSLIVASDINVGMGSLIDCTNTSFTNSSDADITINSVSSTIKILDSQINMNKFKNNVNNMKLDMTYYNMDSVDKGFNILGELHVGAPSLQTSSSFGQGTNFNNTLVVLKNTNNETNSFENVTSQAFDYTANIQLFSSDLANNCLFIGCDYNYYGLSTYINNSIVSDLGSTRVNVEQWDGTNWQTITHMSTKEGAPYYTYADSIIGRNDTKENIRFRNRSNWTKKTIDGQNKFWTRIKLTSDLPIVSDITKKPSVSNIKLHSSRTDISGDGFTEYFGNSRPLASFPFHLGLTDSATGSAGSVDLFLSNNLRFGIRTNSFVKTSVTYVGTSMTLPPDLDTSYPILVDVSFVPASSANGNSHWTLYFNGSDNNSSMFLSTGSAPSVSTGEVAVNKIAAILSSQVNKQITMTFELSTNKFLPNPVSSSSTLCWFSLARNATNSLDTYSGTINLVSMRMRYVKWSNGGHIEAFGDPY